MIGYFVCQTKITGIRNLGVPTIWTYRLGVRNEY
jgi:hypothetical protein